MAKSKLGINLPTDKSSAIDVVEYSKSVETGCTANAGIFSTPPDPIIDLTKQREKTEQSILPERFRSQATDEETEMQKTVLLALLLRNANYVLLVANGNRTIAQLSGHTLNKAEKVKRPPADLALDKWESNVNVPGGVKIRLQGAADGSLFIVQHKDEEGVFRMIDAFNTVIFDVEGLPAGDNILRVYAKKGKVKTAPIEFLVKAW